MNQLIKIMLIATLGLTLLVPFASTAPDAFEKVVQSLGVEPVNVWNGLVSDLVVSVTGNPYLATLINAFIGLFSVAAVAWVVGWASLRRKRV